MGHLINAKAFRLGWFKNWHDSWYSNYTLYPEYLYTSLRIRLYLYFIFTQKQFITRSIIYSHFDVAITNNYLSISVYLYDGRLGSSIISFLKYNTKKIPKYIRKVKYIFQEEVNFLVWRLFLFIKFFGIFRFSRWWLDPDFNWFMFDFIHSAGNMYAKDFLGPVVTLSSLKYNHLTILFGLFLNNIIRSQSLYTNERTGLDKAVFTRVAFILFTYLFYSNIFKNMIDTFTIAFKYMIPSILKLGKIHFFLITEDNMNASILSRYFAVKIKQHFTIKDVYNPVRKELSILRKQYKRLGTLSGLRADLNIYTGRQKFFNFFWLYFFYYTNLNMSKYNSVSNWLSCDKLILYVWLFSTFNNIDLLTFSWLMYNNEKMLSFLLLFNDDNWNIFTDIVNVDFVLLENISLDYIILKVFTAYMVYTNYSVINSDNYNSRWNAGYFKFINFHANDFMRIRYYNYNYEYDAGQRGFNNLRLRDFHPYDLWIFRGFKFQFCGRFSRKQRASFMWYRLGRLPLNTISGNIDYNFFVMPIRNSSICVKVWLFRAKSAPKYTIKLF